MARALVTGATAGIGAEFTRQLAARGDDLVLVARDKPRLEERAEQLRRTGVEVEVLRADLQDRAQVERVAERLSDQLSPVDLLVNNAGFGIPTSVLDVAAVDAIDQAWEVMGRAVVGLSGSAARAMVPRGSGAIINVSSSAGFITMGLYSALKSFVTVFTESLSNDLRGTGVTATALCPGFVHTEFHSRAGIKTTKLPGPAWVNPKQLIRECLSDVAKGKAVSIPSLRYRVAIALSRLAPRSVVRRVSASISKSR